MEKISAEELSRVLEDSQHLLLVDCRSFLDYNKSHIKTAHNVHCPPIVRRRARGTLALENVIRCPSTRSRLAGDDFSLVVVYDEMTENLDSLPADSTLLLVIKTLLQQASVSCVKHLNGGFQKFSELFPSHCEVEDGFTRSLTSPTSAEIPSAQAMCRKVLMDKGGPIAVLPWMYLGNANHATSPTKLKEHNISALLNVSHLEIDVPLAGLQYQRIPVMDNSTANISAWFPVAISFIDSIKEANGRVLVHCQAGISRSATICLAYLMYYKHMKLEQAFDYLKARREIISPNLNFMQQLLEFESQVIPQSSSTRLESPKSAKENNPTSASKASRSGLKLTLTPASSCVQEAAVFVFESNRNRLSPLMHSPALPLCPSPLLSPS